MKGRISTSILLVVAFVGAAAAQTRSGITGEVVSYFNGAVVVGAKITMFASDKRMYEAVSDGDGKYKVELPQGKYIVIVEALGFKKLKRKKVNVEGAGFFTFNVNLRRAGAIIVDESHP